MADRKPRRTKIDIIKDSIAAEFHEIVDGNFEIINQLWKLDNATLQTLYRSIPDEVKPVFKARLENKGTRGAKSNLPYGKEDIARAGKLMSQKAGAKIVDGDGDEYTLISVQILVKVKAGDKVSTLSLSRIAD